MGKLVSIIVPVFNTENYLENCYHSISAQKYSNWELIFIDDGSTDGSLSKLRQFEKKDKRVKVISQDNQGQNAARQAGIKLAEGEYTIFIDSDDWISEDYLTCLINPVISDNNIDVVISRSKPINSKMPLEEGYISYETAFIEMLRRDNFSWPLVAKLYKTNNLKALELDTQFKNGEDLIANYQIINPKNVIYYLDYCGYHITKRENSTSTVLAYKNPDAINAMLYYYNLNKQAMNDNIALRITFSDRFFDIYNSYIFTIAMGNEKKELLYVNQYHEQVKPILECTISKIHCAKLRMELSERYLGDIGQLENNFSHRFEILKQASEDNNLYIYGMGHYAKLVEKVLEERKLTFKGYIVSEVIDSQISTTNHPVDCIGNIKVDSHTLIILGMNLKNTIDVLDNNDFGEAQIVLF